MHEPSPFFAFLPLLIISIPFAIGFFLVAKRVGQNQWVWLILSLIPVMNYFFFLFAGFVVLLHILDKLNALEAKAGTEQSQESS